MEEKTVYRGGPQTDFIASLPFYKRFYYKLKVYADNGVYKWRSSKLSYPEHQNTTYSDKTETSYGDFKIAYEEYCSVSGYEVVDLLSPEMKERLEIEFGVKVKESVKKKEMQGEGRKWTFDNVILKDFNNVKDVDNEDEWIEHVGKIILHQEEQIRKKNNDTEEKKACTELDIFLKEGKKEIKFTTKELDNKTINLNIKKMDFFKKTSNQVKTKINANIIKAPTKNAMKWLKRSMIEIIIVSSHQLFIVTVSLRFL